MIELRREQLVKLVRYVVSSDGTTIELDAHGCRSWIDEGVEHAIYADAEASVSAGVAAPI